MSSIRFLLSAVMLMHALSSCKVYPPVYRRIENFRLEKSAKDGFKVYGDLMMYNPNKMHVKLQDLLLDVELNGKRVATAGQLVEVPIHSQKEFDVPVNLTIKPDMTLLEGVTSIFNIITTKEMNVTLDGVVMIKAYGVKVSVPIHQTENVDISKLR